VQVAPWDLPVFKPDLADLAEATREGDSVLSYDAAMVDASRGRVLVMERWRDQQALSPHLAAADTVACGAMGTAARGRYQKGRRDARGSLGGRLNLSGDPHRVCIHRLCMIGIDRYRTLSARYPDAAWLRFDGGLTWDADDAANKIMEKGSIAQMPGKTR